MEWIPTVFIAFKVLVLGIGMFVAVKWHYDRGLAKGTENRRAVLRSSVKLGLLFAVLAIVLLFLTLRIGTMLGVDLGGY
jgi:hypothetical protein